MLTTLQNRNKRNAKKGFTLTELAIVIAVIAILIAVLVPTFTSIITKANESNALQTAKNAITEYTIETYEVPEDGSVIVVKEGSNTYTFIVVGSVPYEVSDNDLTADYSALVEAISNTESTGMSTALSTYASGKTSTNSSKCESDSTYETYTYKEQYTWEDETASNTYTDVVSLYVLTITDTAYGS